MNEARMVELLVHGRQMLKWRRYSDVGFGQTGRNNWVVNQDRLTEGIDAKHGAQ